MKPPEIKKLADRMLAEKYQDDRGWGYMLAEVRKSFLTGKFIEKNKRTESFADPFGKTQTYEIISYQEINFRLQSEWPQLRIENPPRSLGPFFTSIGEYLDFQIGISEIAISPNEWVRAVESICNEVKVLKAQISDLAVSNLTAAGLIITGSEDVRKYFKKLTLDKPYTVSSVQIECKKADKIIKFEVNAAARVKIMSDNDESCDSFFRDCLNGFKNTLKVEN